jgi:hypothetical protein
MAERFNMKTDVGMVKVSVWGPDHVSVEAGEAVNGNAETPPLTVNRIALACSGSWEFKSEGAFGPGWRPNYFKVKRFNSNWSADEAPKGASGKVFDAVRKALTAWSVTDIGASMLGLAGIAVLEREAAGLEEDARRLRVEAAEKDEQAKAKRAEAAIAPKSVKLTAAPAFMSEKVDG